MLFQLSHTPNTVYKHRQHWDQQDYGCERLLGATGDWELNGCYEWLCVRLKNLNALIHITNTTTTANS